MRTKITKISIAAAIAFSGLAISASQLPVQAAINNDVPFQQQSELDQESLGDCSSWCAGGWGAMEGGVGARPFIKDLSVVRINDDLAVDSNVLDNPSNDPIPTRVDGTNVDATVSAINLCAPSQSNNCYETPNRVQINFGWRDGGQGTGDLGASGSIPAIDADSEIRVTIGLNTLGQSLRWSYLEGTPTYWKVTNIGQEDATIELHFKPAMKPWTSNGGGCSQIPVNETCEYTSADAEYLMGSLLLSLDDTLDSVFTGALFAGEGLYIGSLEANEPQQTETGGSQPTMTYGIAAPRTINGTTNSPSFAAFLSDQTILNYFGATPEVAATAGFFNAAFAVSSTGAGSGANAPTITPTRWTTDDNGSDGWLISISDISLSTLNVNPSGRIHAAARVVRNPRIQVKNKLRAPSVSATRTGVVVSGSIQGCTANGNCRIVVNRIMSKTGGRVVSLGTAVLAPNGNSLRATLNFARISVRDPRLSIVIQKKKANGRWGTYVTSVVRRAN
jgi:hypothetical protein